MREGERESSSCAHRKLRFLSATTLKKKAAEEK